MKAIVIGSGLSGLTAAAALAQAGHDVTVLEQYQKAGGVTASVEQDGFRWDLGQLLLEGLGPDEPIGQILARLGVLDHIQAVKDDRTYVFPDFTIHRPENCEGSHWRIDLLKKLFPQDAGGLERYWKDYGRLMAITTLGRRMEKLSGLDRFYHSAQLYLKLAPFLTRLSWSAQRLMDDYFTSRQLQAVFISILADFFTPPSQFTGLGVFVLNPETVFDCRLPKELGKDAEQLYQYSLIGGTKSLVEALVARIEACGGKVITGCAVQKIAVENQRVTGVVTAGDSMPCDVVIATGAARETFNRLVGADQLSPDFIAKVGDLPLMESVFMVNLGINFDPRPFIQSVCTYYYGTYDIEGGIAEARQGIYHGGRLGFVVHVPTLRSPHLAPPGCHALTIYTICPNRLIDGNWSDRKEEYAERLVAYAERHIPGLKVGTVTRMILSPEEFRSRTHTNFHAFGGLAPIMGKKGIPYRTPLNGLWFVGAQSESGGGTNNVINGAWKAAGMILKTLR